uniref:ANK_REP_REGION domain-containing protein n=1 Tax=Enterobius vermicularis TaxID=51028 RepID=A0A0N4UZV6_ENTVE
MSIKGSDNYRKTDSSRQSSVERYAFGYTNELQNQECSISQAKRLRERLQRQQSGQSGRKYTGESSECSSLVGTPTESGRSFTFVSPTQKTLKDERNPSISQNLSELMLDVSDLIASYDTSLFCSPNLYNFCLKLQLNKQNKKRSVIFSKSSVCVREFLNKIAIHFDDLFLVERTLAMYSNKQPLLSSSPSVGSTNTLSDLTQKRHHSQRRSNTSSTLSIHSSGKSTCAVLNTLHMAIAHKKYEIAQRLLEWGFDPNALAMCHCKGGCTATGNIPLMSITTSRAPSVTPELCTVCAQLRVVSIINQTPLAIAVRAQSAEIIALLTAYGADPNLSDEEGNTPLMIAVRECPSSINILYALVFFGSQIELKNVRGTSPLDLSPELRKVQARCIEDLFSKACCVGMKSECKEDSRRLAQKTSTPLKNILVKNLSTTPSVSATSLIDAALVRDRSLKRKSQSSTQLYKKQIPVREEERNGNDDAVWPSAWERAWILLKKMAVNPECLEVIRVMMQKYVGDMEVSPFIPDRDAFDGHLGGLLHRMLQTSIAEYQSATPTYREAKKLHLLDILSSLAKFCFQYLQKEGTCRQFAALNTLNKVTNQLVHASYIARKKTTFCRTVVFQIIDAGLVHELFVFPDITFYSSRFLKKNSTYEDEFSEVNSLCDSLQPSDDQKSTVDHVFFYSCEKNGHDFPGLFQRHPTRKLDLIDVFASAQPSQSNFKISAFQNCLAVLVVAFLCNALTVERREAGMRPICSPAHRWRQCWKHCTQVLIARLMLFLSHITSFRAGMSCEEQLSPLAKLLDPTLDPQLLCLLLQTLALLALDPATHKLFVELDIDDKLVQLILPADDCRTTKQYHTNHSTCYGRYVKYHAARILVYVGMGDRVSNRVSIFHFSGSECSIGRHTIQPDEDDCICQTCSTPNTLDRLDKRSISVEQVLLEILEELDKKLQHKASVDPITEETSNVVATTSDGTKETEKEEAEKRSQWDEHSDDSSVILENLREHLCKISIIVDPMLILRLLLHKLIWDLSVVKKKVAVIDSLKVGMSRIRYSASLGANISKAGKSEKRYGKDENYLTVGRCSSRSSRRVKIRRTSSLDLPETNRFSSFIRTKERRKRLGTDTSSSSKCSRKTGSSVSKHFPKYIKTLLRKRTVTDPVRKHPPRDSSVDSNTSESEILEFARKLQNYPLTRREALRQAMMQSGEQDSFSDKPKPTCNFLPELEVQAASPPRSPLLLNPNSMEENNSSSLVPNLLGERRPSSPQAIPGLPLIEIRRPSALSQIEFDYFINSPEMTCSDVSDCSPLLLTNGVQMSRKSSDESSIGGWSSRASSVMSQRSSRSSACMRLSTSYSRRTSKASITSDNSGLFLFRFAVRKRASTVGTRIPIPRRALSPLSRSSASDSLRVSGRESPLFPVISEMNPDFHCVRQLVVDLLGLYSNKRPNIVSAVEECAEVMRQILSSPQHPKIKSWYVKFVSFCTSTLVSHLLKRYGENFFAAGAMQCNPMQSTDIQYGYDGLLI